MAKDRTIPTAIRIGELERMLELRDDCIAHLTKDLETVRRGWSDDRTRAQAAEASLKEARTNFGDLKGQLYDSNLEAAKLSGYRDRVREEDATRERRSRPPILSGWDMGKPGSERMALHMRRPNHDAEPNRAWLNY